MLGTYKSKTDTVVSNKPTSKTTRTRTTNTGENGPKTRSASTRRAQEQPVVITYLGRSRGASDSEATTGAGRSRRPSPVVATKRVERNVFPVTKKEDLSSSSVSSTDSSAMSARAQWNECTEALNEIGAAAKRDNKHIRRLKTMITRRATNFEKEVAKDERLTLVATRLLSNRNSWTLNACHAYLPVIIENLINANPENQSIALNGLEAITDTWMEKICQFAAAGATRIGVDVTAEQRVSKAKDCVEQFRGVVKNRDCYYKKMDETSIYKFDNILAQLKKA